MSIAVGTEVQLFKDRLFLYKIALIVYIMRGRLDVRLSSNDMDRISACKCATHGIDVVYTYTHTQTHTRIHTHTHTHIVLPLSEMDGKTSVECIGGKML